MQSRQDALSVEGWDVASNERLRSAVSGRFRCIRETYVTPILCGGIALLIRRKK